LSRFLLSPSTRFFYVHGAFDSAYAQSQRAGPFPKHCNNFATSKLRFQSDSSLTEINAAHSLSPLQSPPALRWQQI
jgi:hypothetical protein